MHTLISSNSISFSVRLVLKMNKRNIISNA